MRGNLGIGTCRRQMRLEVRARPPVSHYSVECWSCKSFPMIEDTERALLSLASRATRSSSSLGDTAVQVMVNSVLYSLVKSLSPATDLALHNKTLRPEER
jgi:hypothetical protein